MTRKQLIEFFINELKKYHGKPEITTDVGFVFHCTDALIKEGYVKVDEPREYWLCLECMIIGWFDGKCGNDNAHKLIHVKEVL